MKRFFFDKDNVLVDFQSGLKANGLSLAQRSFLIGIQ